MELCCVIYEYNNNYRNILSYLYRYDVMLGMYLCVCQQNGTSQYAEGWNDLNVFVSLREQFKQSRHIECLNKHFCSLGRQMLTIYIE